jgi:hypothetical protein
MSPTSGEFSNRIARDCERVGIPGLKELPRRAGRPLRFQRRHRLPDACAILLALPEDRAATVLFFRELFAWTARQVGGSVVLGPTFVRTVSELAEDVLAALPQHSRAGLARLAEIASQEPLEITHYERTASALATDGELVAWLSNDETKATKPKADAQQIYRKLAQQLHPDKGGDPEAMAALNELWRAVKKSA